VDLGGGAHLLGQSVPRLSVEDISIETEWFFIDVGGAYHCGGGFYVLGGIRYDYLEGTTANVLDDLSPAFQQFGQGASLPNYKIDANANSIFPYLGAMLRLSSAQSDLTAIIKASPAVIYPETETRARGYFGELVLAYTLYPLRSASISLFGKANVIHVVLEESTGLNVFPINPLPEINNTPAEQTTVVHWQGCTLGGALSFNFVSPF
jgi:hypothetical protein